MEELRKQIYERDSEQARDLLKLNSIYMKEVFENYFCSDVLKEFNYIIYDEDKNCLRKEGLELFYEFVKEKIKKINSLEDLK